MKERIEAFIDKVFDIAFYVGIVVAIIELAIAYNIVRGVVW